LKLSSTLLIVVLFVDTIFYGYFAAIFSEYF